MRIAFVLHTLNPASGGVASAAVELAQSLSVRGHSVTLITFDASNRYLPRALPSPLSCLPLGPTFGSYGFVPCLSKKLKPHVSAFDIVILNGLWLYSTYGVSRWAYRNKIPTLLFPHGMLDPYFKRVPLKHLKKLLYFLFLEQSTVAKARALCYTTSSELALAQKTFPMFKPRRQEVVGLGLRSCEGSLIDAKNQFWEGFPSLKNKRFFLYLSRLHPKKGPNLLLEALEQFPNATLVMAGPAENSSYYGDLRRLACLLRAQVVWTGLLTGTQKWGALAAAEALILPSHQENFGMVVAEALSVGTPVLISDKVALAEEVMSGYGGFVDADTLQGTVSLIRRFLKLSAHEISAMRDRAIECYKNNFLPEMVAERMENLIREVLKPVVAAPTGRERDGDDMS